MYGFEYIHPNGSKRRWLNVELIRTNMEQPRASLVLSTANVLITDGGAMAQFEPVDDTEIFDLNYEQASLAFVYHCLARLNPLILKM
jgi:hypothetical protein